MQRVARQTQVVYFQCFSIVEKSQHIVATLLLQICLHIHGQATGAAEGKQPFTALQWLCLSHAQQACCQKAKKNPFPKHGTKLRHSTTWACYTICKKQK